MLDYLHRLNQEGADAVIGSKRHPGSVVEYPVLRRLASYLYEGVTRSLFWLGTRDTQTGAKLFRRAAVADALGLTSEKGFAFDVELLVAMAASGHHRTVSAPVNLTHRRQSTVTMREAAKVVWATVRIAGRKYLIDGYRPQVRSAGQAQDVSLEGFSSFARAVPGSDGGWPLLGGSGAGHSDRATVQ